MASGTLGRLAILVPLLVLGAGTRTVAAQQIVTVSTPPAVSFAVTNVSVTTTGAPSPVTVGYSNATLFLLGQRLRISVKADTSSFSAPQGSTAIPAESVSWVVSSAVSGSGSSGTLSAVSYGEVYRSNTNVSSGSADVTWRLAPLPAAGLRSGSQTLTVRWRIEAM